MSRNGNALIRWNVEVVLDDFGSDDFEVTGLTVIPEIDIARCSGGHEYGMKKGCDEAGWEGDQSIPPVSVSRDEVDIHSIGLQELRKCLDEWLKRGNIHDGHVHEDDIEHVLALLAGQERYQ